MDIVQQQQQQQRLKKQNKSAVNQIKATKHIFECVVGKLKKKREKAQNPNSV